MGKGRNGLGNEQSALLAAVVALGGALLGGCAKFASEQHDTSRITNLNAKIDANEAEKKELSKGFGRLTNSEKIDELNQKNAELKAKRNKYMK